MTAPKLTVARRMCLQAIVDVGEIQTFDDRGFSGRGQDDEDVCTRWLHAAGLVRRIPPQPADSEGSARWVPTDAGRAALRGDK